MNPNGNNPQAERERYVRSFNSTMIKIWREKMTLLGVFHTGALYRSTMAVSLSAEEKFTSVTLSQSFNTYGLFVDYGTGGNTPRGNPGDIGKSNLRKRKRWFSRKYYASVMNIQEFFADNLGRDCCLTIAYALNPDLMRRQITL